MMNRNMLLVNWLILVVVMYALHIIFPNIQLRRLIVVTRNGIPIRKHSSAIARFTMYMFVTVCIFENRNTT